jgi:hypothetical protein
VRKVDSMIGYYLQYRFGGRENDGIITCFYNALLMETSILTRRLISVTITLLD